MNYELVKKQYELLNEPISKEDKNFIFKYLLNEDNTDIDILLYYGELLEEKEEKE